MFLQIARGLKKEKEGGEERVKEGKKYKNRKNREVKDALKHG